MPSAPSRTELAWEFAELFGDFSTADMNELLSKNIPMETLEFFTSYAESFGSAEGIKGLTAERLPNLMMVGYLIRILEERVLDTMEEPS
ncbi:MAG: hypothetical protein HKP27_15995 [Myxococcales bacterium]|nr:hypothetical protein [Myxococcales bacterium]